MDVAPAYQRRIPPQDLLGILVSQNRPISPVWNWPSMDGSIFKLDWLRAADQGVASTFLGSILVLVIYQPGLKCLGNTQDARRVSVWRTMEALYKDNKISTDKLSELPERRFRLKPPLKAQAGTIRQLIPFFRGMVEPWTPDNSNAEFMAVKAAMISLSECYACLSSQGPSMQHLLEQSALFGVQLSALHALNPEKYALKPKLHLFLELCSLGVRPAQCCNYREEDFGGSMAAMCHRAGGRKTPLALSRTCLNRFCIRAPPPKFASLGGESSTKGASSSTGP